MDPNECIGRERLLKNAVLGGDEPAWRTWYDESFPGLYAYVVWRCAGLRDLADEIVQDTWLTAVRRIRKFEPEQGGFQAWLRGIAANAIRNRLRQAQRWNRRFQPLNDDAAAANESDPTQDERAQRIAEALTAIPDHYEAVLRAKYLDGRSTAQIAADRKETVKAVESLLTRARQAFREAYQRLERLP